MVFLEGEVDGNLTNNCCGMLGQLWRHEDLDGNNSSAFVDQTAKQINNIDMLQFGLAHVIVTVGHSRGTRKKEKMYDCFPQVGYNLIYGTIDTLDNIYKQETQSCLILFVSQWKWGITCDWMF